MKSFPHYPEEFHGRLPNPNQEGQSPVYRIRLQDMPNFKFGNQSQLQRPNQLLLVNMPVWFAGRLIQRFWVSELFLQ